jgi:hypothetical protein
MARIMILLLLFVWFVFFVFSCILLNEGTKRMEDKTSENFRVWVSITSLAGFFIGISAFLMILLLARRFRKLK